MTADFLQWMEQMSVGDQMLDDDHKKLISMINRTYELVEEENGDREELGPS